ncbi:MAG: tyrosine--tRNA ligase [Elusimicrobiota bacterium]
MKEFLDVIKRGTLEIISENELLEKLKKKKKLTIKFGADPTAADIHLGHTVVLEKLRQFQDLGHDVIFIIGDFTARIGDPSGRNVLRKPMTKDEIESNAKTYNDQMFKILDKKKTKIVYNSAWLDKLGVEGILNLASKYTVARMLERDDFQKRYQNNSPISILEFLYPLIQGYDSIELKADVEIGGSDQKFNLLVGRELQRHFGQEPQVVITLPLLEGLDGEKKMSKSYDNYVGVSEEPFEMFGKIMSISDDLMWRYYELLTQEDIKTVKELHPKKAKQKLASLIVSKFHSKNDADEALNEFERVFQKHSLPSDMETFAAQKDNVNIVELLISSNMVSSKNEARRMIEQGGVKINQEKISDMNHNVVISNELVLQVGKRKFKKITK